VRGNTMTRTTAQNNCLGPVPPTMTQNFQVSNDKDTITFIMNYMGSSFRNVYARKGEFTDISTEDLLGGDFTLGADSLEDSELELADPEAEYADDDSELELADPEAENAPDESELQLADPEAENAPDDSELQLADPEAE